jgi:hypothetical protein
MGDHTAYFRSAPGEEEMAFVRLGRRLAGKCEEITWRDSRSHRLVGGRQNGVKSRKRVVPIGHEPMSLSSILNIDIDSLEESDLAQRIKCYGATAANTFFFDARVAPGHEVGGYLDLMLATSPFQLQEGSGDFRLWMDFRLGYSQVAEEEFDPDSLESRAFSIAFLCGASIDRRPISEIEECIVVREGVAVEEGRIFSRYFNSIRAIVAQLERFQSRLPGTKALLAGANAASPLPIANLGLLKLMSDPELLKWYLEIANHLPGYRARKCGKGLLTSTTDSSGMSLLYAALLRSLE